MTLALERLRGISDDVRRRYVRGDAVEDIADSLDLEDGQVGAALLAAGSKARLEVLARKSNGTPSAAYPGRTLGELLSDPNRGQLPTEVIPHLAYLGRVLLFGGREKIGKTSYVLQEAADASAGRPGLFGAERDPVTVLLFSLEDPEDDTIRMLANFGADRDRMIVVFGHEIPTPADFERAAERPGVGLVIVDTLTELSRLFGVKDPDDSVEARAMVSRLIKHARQNHAAWTATYHSARTHNDPRGSTDWAATADIIVRFAARSEDDPGRTLSIRGRGVRSAKAAVQFVDGRYVVDTPPVAEVTGSRRSKPKAHSQRVALQALRTIGKPASYTKWQLRTGLKESTFQAAYEALTSLGLTERTEAGDEWTITDKARRLALDDPAWQL